MTPKGWMNAHLRYFRYVLAHKWYVFRAGQRTGAPLWRLVIHDWSKFLPSEWGPYVRYFYCDNSGEGLEAIGRFGLAELAPWGFYAKDHFNHAWLLHQNRQPHHWQYWVLINDNDTPQQVPLPIPEHFIREMVADWAGAGRTFTGGWDLPAWYAKNRDKQQIHPDSRPLVDELVELFG